MCINVLEHAVQILQQYSQYSFFGGILKTSGLWGQSIYRDLQIAS